MRLRGSWWLTRTEIYWPPLLWPSALCLPCSPEAHSAWCWLSLLHLISNFSGPQLIRAPRASSARLLYHILSSNSSNFQLSDFLSWLSSTPTQSPTRSLEWHVWLSSSGNNCHAVQRSLSSGASVYESIMGFFTLSHFISQARPRDLFRLLAIGMCHFFLVHHFVMACLPGPKVKIQQVNFFLEGTKFLSESPMCRQCVSPPRHMAAPLSG